MKLNYREIMGLGLPPGALNIEALEEMCILFTTGLTAYFARAREGQWEAGNPYLVKRVAYYRRMISTSLRDVRLGKMYNFALRVKTWVLLSKARRLRLRALIGEHAIAHWYAQLDALMTAHTSVDLADTPDTNTKETDTDIRTEKLERLKFPNGGYVRPWYRLASLPRADLSQSQIYSANGTSHSAPCPNPRCEYRAIPAIAFWPHELVENYIADDEALGVIEECVLQERVIEEKLPAALGSQSELPIPNNLPSPDAQSTSCLETKPP